ncbi:MAG: polyhydroxyalkanoate synthesis regulator DNA-binding domain-containing protein [Desulfobacterales bacterium]|jgi:polyhydroxyalkanoate synthesis repressor PhaR|nr:polyhydroxyalkanoate synthesis regulator DNA-binding domain-containing protein [Desulfobacterales bacterium]
MRKIKKYANRKLYDTMDKQYISMEQLADLIRSGESVSILDNQTGQDITVQILSQLLSKDKRQNDSEVLTDLLSQMLRRGGTTIADYAKRYTSKWQEAVVTAEEEIERIARQLLKDKDLSEGDGQKKKEEIKQYVGKLKDWISEKVDQRINDVLGMMNLASKDQVNRLAGEMTAIGARLEAIERLLKGPQPEKKDPKDETD